MNNNQQQIITKPISNMEFHLLGIPKDCLQIVETLEDLKRNPPNIVVANCIKNVRFQQNYFKDQQLNKGSSYVMGLGVYNQLHYDVRTKLEILKPSKIQFKNVYKPYNGQNLDNKTLLVFRTGGIGDLLFIQPNLTHLKKKYPTSTIKFACGPQYQSMVKEWDCVDEVLDLPFNLTTLLSSDYHCIFEGVIERCKLAEKECSYNLFTKWMGLNLENELLIPKQEPNKENLEKNKKVLEELGLEENDFIVVQMRASSPVRTPNPVVWRKLIEMLVSKGHNILLTDIPRNYTDIENFISKLDCDKEKVKNFSKFSETIGDTISIVSLSKLSLSTDSALIHIAESLNKKSFGIYGPFPGEIRLSTYKNCDWINIECSCAPCFSHNHVLCKNSYQGYVMCYNSLKIEECVEKIENHLNKELILRKE